MQRIFTAALAAVIATGVAAAPAHAATQITGADICNQTSTTAYTNCVAYAGNLLNGSSIADLNAALDTLIGGNYSPDAVWANLDPTKLLISGSGNDPTGTITFAQSLLGNTILGVHFGNAGTGAGNRTQFYLFDFGTPTTQLSLNTQGFSDGVIINGPVPEPATWVLMLLGFGFVGFAMRRRNGEGNAARIRVAYS